MDAKLSKNSLGNDSGRTFDGFFSMNFDALRGHSHVLSIAIMNNDPKTGGSHWDPPDALRGLILTHGLGCLGCVELSSAGCQQGTERSRIFRHGHQTWHDNAEISYA